ncbi:MAG: hypothetical protein K2X02_08345 [Alphaproteobacteria bacterium]|nr:hypothetical protein [Alphaproteobacteria bacterium]
MNSSNFSFEGKVITTEKFSKELDYPIQSVIYLENKQSFIVLYDMDSNIRKWGQFPNIICFSAGGNKLWIAELPTTDTGDSYCQMKFKNGKLTAYSWKSYSCEIDINTGKIKEAIFVK